MKLSIYHFIANILSLDSFDYDYRKDFLTELFADKSNIRGFIKDLRGELIEGGYELPNERKEMYRRAISYCYEMINKC